MGRVQIKLAWKSVRPGREDLCYVQAEPLPTGGFVMKGDTCWFAEAAGMGKAFEDDYRGKTDFEAKAKAWVEETMRGEIEANADGLGVVVIVR